MAHAMTVTYRPSSFAGTVASTNAARVVRLGQRRGACAKAPPPGPADRIAAARMFAIWADLVHELDAPELPLETARHFRMEDLGLLGLVVMTAPTPLAGLESFVRYGALLNDGRSMELESDDRTVTLTLHDGAPLALGVRLSHEATLAQVARGMKELVGPRVTPRAVSFRHELAAGAGALRTYFSCPVELGAAHDRLVFDRLDLDTTRPGANMAVWRYLARQAEDATAALVPRPLGARARDAITRAIREGTSPDLAATASSLGTSGRTLRRALEAEGTSFRALLDATKRARAEELLRGARHSLTRIALDLGFSDSSAFAHACHRWFGCAPSEVARGGRLHAPCTHTGPGTAASREP